MTANSVDPPCPANRRGRATPSQAGAQAPGVCNEQMLSPGGKVCSGLRGNVQKAAETTASPAKARSNKNDDPVDRLGREHDTEQRLPPGGNDLLRKY